MIRVALAGNPNCGKTTLFNALTGSTAYVGNWPGVTVEKRSGVYYSKKDTKKTNGFEIVDLPGIYSLSPYTSEEIISRNYILNEQPDVVIAVVDGTNLERNLYLASQILEIDVPVVIAVNMTDVLEKDKKNIDYSEIEKQFGVPTVGVSALHSKGLEDLMKAVAKVAGNCRKGVSLLPEKEILEASAEIYRNAGVASPLFHAIKALEKDKLEREENEACYIAVNAKVTSDSNYDVSIPKDRYAVLEPICKKAINSETKGDKKLSKSEKADRVLTHKWWAIPILIVILFAIFHVVFAADFLYLGAMGVNFGEGYEGLIEITVSGEDPIRPFAGLFWTADGINSPGEILHVLAGDNESGILGCISLGIKQLFVLWEAPEWVMGFIYDGVLNGVASVLGFVPQIMLLFFCFSLLEDSGYMARISFVLDRIFRRLGVSGRAFLPMIMGFGCGVPAMMNTRTLGSDKERVKTMRVIPFFTCGAKAEFLVAIAAALAAVSGFDKGLFTFLIYAFGVIVAMIAVVVMSKTTQREITPPFIIELPSYHRPSLRSLLIHVWDRGKHFIEKAFTIILLSTVIVWFLANFGWENGSFGMMEADAKGSILYYIGTGLSYIFTPMGFGPLQIGDSAWAFSVASVEGIIAKENVTAVLETLSANIVGPGSSLEDLAAYCHISNAGLVAFAVFNMLTIPCFASIGTARGELKNAKDLWLTIAFWLGTSYALGVIAYVSFEFIWPIAIVVAGAILAVFFLIIYDKHMKQKEALASANE